MQTLHKEELLKIQGGGAGIVIAGLIALATLIVGIYDGFTRPLSCHE